MEKLDEIGSVAGIAGEKPCNLTEKDLEGDLDPDEFDRKMNVMFDDTYYRAEDDDFHSHLIDNPVKPKFEEDDELFGLPKGPYESVPPEGFLANSNKNETTEKEGKHARAAASDMKATGDADNVEDHCDGRKKKRQIFSRRQSNFGERVR